MAFYKAMIARRKASPAMSRGTTTFIDLPEPLLAFTRTAKDERLTCVFNLSKTRQEVAVSGASGLALAGRAKLEGDRLVLDGNGFAYLAHEGDIALTVP